MIENKFRSSAPNGEKAKVRFREMKGNSPLLGEASGIGLALEIAEDKKTGKPATNLTKRLRRLAHQRGVMIEVGGHHNNVARHLPPS